MSGAAYTRTARVLHWSVAALVLGLLVIGTAMVHVDLDVVTTVALYQAHKSLGLIVLVLMCARLAWRWRHAPPRVSDEIGLVRRRIAAIVHVTTYGLLFALPVSGWLSASAAPIVLPFFLFGIVEVPPLLALADLPLDERISVFARIALTHRVLAWSLASLVILHVAGALWPARHRHVVLARMWPRRPA